MRWPWRREARIVKPRQAVSIRAQELETAKEILVEVFYARPGEVEGHLQLRNLISSIFLDHIAIFHRYMNKFLEQHICHYSQHMHLVKNN
jgi:hypothetical protein